MKFFLILPVSFCVFFLGCRSGVNHSISSLKKMIPDHWETKNNFTERNSTNGFWLLDFDDPWLDQTVRSAWAENPNITMMAERVIAFGEDAIIAGASLFPAAQADLIGTRSKRNLVGFIPNNDTSFTAKSFNSGINISWEIDLWGKLRDHREAVSMRFESTRAGFEAARLSLAAQVAKNWFELVENGMQVNLAEETVQTYEKNRNFVSNRFNQGLASALDDHLSKSSLASARANLNQRKRLMDSKLRSFHILLGRYPSAELDRNLSTELPNLELIDLPSTPAKVLENRPDLEAARFQVEASGLELNFARKGLLPSFSIIGGPGSRSEEFEDLLDQRFRTWDIGGSLSQPLLQGGRIQAQTRKAKALRNAAFAEYRSITLKAFGEVESLLSSEGYLIEEEKLLQQASQNALYASDISWERYQNGVEAIFNALDTQRRSFEAKSRFLTTRKERILNRINLYLALGQPALPIEP